MLVTLFQNGGWGMFPVLGLGLLGLAAAAHYAARADARSRGSIEALSRALVWTIVVAVSTDFMAVFHALTNESIPEAQLTRILYMGSWEALSPLPMGAAFLVLIWLLVAVGQRRVDARVPAV